MIEPVIPYARQSISEADIAAVVAVLRGDWLTQGPAVPAFEAAVAEKCGARHAVAVNSATSALHLACLALDVGAGDLVWTTPNTFVASANCARYCGAAVDFVDIDPQSWTMSPGALAEKLAQARASGGQLPKVVIPVHYAGMSCDMAAISALAAEYGFGIIEDASHAIGGMLGDTAVGSCRYSDIVVLSFHPVKIITTGEGGMALTNREELAERMARLRTHGILQGDSARVTQHPAGPRLYKQVELGFNYRMTDVAAALGLSQMSRLDEFVERRNVLAERYNAAFADLPVARQRVPAGVVSAYHLYVIRMSAADRTAFLEFLLGKGVGVNLHYIPVHLHPYYRALGFSDGQFPEAEAHAREAVTLPLFPALLDREHDAVVRACREWWRPVTSR